MFFLSNVFGLLYIIWNGVPGEQFYIVKKKQFILFFLIWVEILQSSFAGQCHRFGLFQKHVKHLKGLQLAKGDVLKIPSKSKN